MNDLAKRNLAYVIGAALGDGNLSNPNGRATRLRITCDAKYPNLANELAEALKTLFPKNKVSFVVGPKDTYFNLSVYSNKLNDLMPWKVHGGSKFLQKARVPQWVLDNKTYSAACLKGLLQTDGSIYEDRGYKMINFTNNIIYLAQDVKTMFVRLGYEARMYKTNQKSGRAKYTVRLAKNVDHFLQETRLQKF